MPVMLQLRIRACHLSGRFNARDNRQPTVSRNRLLAEPNFNIDRFCLPPATYAQEKHKVEHRLPAAERFITENKLNEVFEGELSDVGIITMGGLYNGVLRALERVGLADIYGASRIPIYVMNVTYPLVPKEIQDFCAGKTSVLVVEEGHPDYIEQAINVALRKGDLQTRVLGKGVLPKVGEYTADVVLEGVEKFLELLIECETKPCFKFELFKLLLKLL